MATYTIGSDPGDDYETWTAFHAAVASPAAGSIISFRKGDTFRETVTVANSGSDGSPITYTAHGTGADPIISGADLVTGWTDNAASISETFYPSENADDKRKYDTGSTGIVDDDFLHIGDAGGGTVHDNYVRYRSVTVPKDAVVTEAYIRITSYDSKAVTECNIRIEGELSATPSQVSTVQDFDNKVRTTATVSWDNVAAWTDGNQYDSPSITSIVSEITSLAGWVSGNNLSIFCMNNSSDDSALRIGSSFNYSSGSEKPELHITYTQEDVWKATLTTEPKQVFFDGVRGTLQASATDCTAAGHWYWAGNVLYVYYEEDPDGAVSIEAVQRNYGVNIDTKSYIIVDGLEIKNIDQAGILICDGSDYNTIKNNTISYVYGTGGARSGVFVNGGVYNTIDSNTISYCYIGVQMSGYGDVDSDNNTVSNNTISYINASAIQLYGENTYAPKGNIVENNDVSYFCQSYDDGAGAWVYPPSTTQPSTGNIIRYNKFYNGGTAVYRGAGVMLDSYTDDDVVYYNLIYGNSNGGIQVAGVGHQIYNNVIYNNQTQGWDTGEICLYEATEDATNITVKNNILYGSSGKEVLIVSAGAVTNGGHTIDYNAVYSPDDSTPYAWNGTEYNFTDWKTNSSQSANSINTDPLMTNPGSDDFTLQFGSPCINRGAHVGLFTDYRGTGYPVPIGHRPDIGAYEHKNGGRIF